MQKEKTLEKLLYKKSGKELYMFWDWPSET